MNTKTTTQWAAACAVGLVLGFWGAGTTTRGQDPAPNRGIGWEPVEAQPGDDPERKLVIARYNVALKAVAAVRASYQQGTSTLADLATVQRRALDAAVDLSANDPHLRIKLAKGHLEATKNVEAQMEGLATAGARGGEEANLYTAQFERLNAEIILLRLEKALAPATKGKK